MILFVVHIQQSIAPGQYILPSGFEIIHIPWVGNIAGVDGIVQQQTFLADIAAADTANIRYVGPVHPDQEAALVAIGAGELQRRFSGTVDAMLLQFAPHQENKPSRWSWPRP